MERMIVEVFDPGADPVALVRLTTCLCCCRFCGDGSFRTGTCRRFRCCRRPCTAPVREQGDLDIGNKIVCAERHDDVPGGIGGLCLGEQAVVKIPVTKMMGTDIRVLRTRATVMPSVSPERPTSVSIRLQELFGIFSSASSPDAAHPAISYPLRAMPSSPGSRTRPPSSSSPSR